MKQQIEDYCDYYHNTTFKHEILEGTVVDSIIDFAETKPFDLIIMGTKGAGKKNDKFIGSNASGVIRKVNCPVLVIPEQASYKQIRKIVYALDYKNTNVDPIRDLKSFANKTDAEIILLHVSQMKHYFEGSKMDNYRNAMTAVADYDHFRFEFVESEDICQAIEEFVQKHDIDVLAILTKDYHLIQRAYDKSPIKKMLFYGEMPLLVFHE